MKQYKLGIGTVRPCIYSTGPDPLFIVHFGQAEYDHTKPVLTEPQKQQVQPIINALNTGSMTEAEAAQKLAEIW